MREHLEDHAASRHSGPDAGEALKGPRLPLAVRYLWEWALQLYGRSGMGPSGYAPLSHAELAAWSEFTDNYPTPRDVRALMKIDTALRGFGTKQKSKAGPPKKRVDPPWPE